MPVKPQEALDLRLQAYFGFLGVISGPVHPWRAFLFKIAILVRGKEGHLDHVKWSL